uniref:Peptidase M20 dimerisation domain-containing protein n=1 Tax=Lynx canadensis TaxID=61383 RepID=A0A667H5W5_LYNCA
ARVPSADEVPGTRGELVPVRECFVGRRCQSGRHCCPERLVSPDCFTGGRQKKPPGRQPDAPTSPLHRCGGAGLARPETCPCPPVSGGVGGVRRAGSGPASSGSRSLPLLFCWCSLSAERRGVPAKPRERALGAQGAGRRRSPHPRPTWPRSAVLSRCRSVVIWEMPCFCSWREQIAVLKPSGSRDCRVLRMSSHQVEGSLVSVQVECSDRDLHSGVYGGSVHEAMTDLILLMGSLMDKKGKILIPGISEAVAPVTEEELALYDKIDFDLDEYTRDVGAETLLHGCKKDILMHRWR